MFATDQPKLSCYARSGPDALARVLKFCVLTIRQPFFNMAADMAELDAPSTPESEAAILWGFKRAAVEQIEAERVALYEQAERAFICDPGDAANSIPHLFAHIYGLGLVKAGFAAQIAYGLSACLDTRNAARYGLDREKLRFRTYWKPKTQRRAVERYNATCDKLGGSAALWDNWCNHLAELQSERWRDGAAVSAFHCEAILPPNTTGA